MSWLSIVQLGMGLLANWQRILIYAALAALVAGALVGYGYHKGVQQKWEYQAEQAKEGARIVVKQGKVTEKIITRYVEVAGQTRAVTEYVEREVNRYAENNPGLCLDPDWRRLHDRAAANRVPDRPEPVHDPRRTPDAAPGRRGFAIGS